MPARVHAILVVRPEGRTPAAAHLRRTLDALAAQTRPVDALTIVLCGPDEQLRELAARSGAEGVITAAHGTGFAAATALATPRLSGDAVWLLAQDTAPAPDALARLAGALELAASVAFVAPKLVAWDDRGEIVSLGVGMTRRGSAIELAAGELDQGQHDAAEDVLGADVRGILVRRDAWRDLGGLDTALAGADEGLDLGVRARLAGGRVTVVPAAVVAVAGDGVAGLPGAKKASRRHYAARRAQLHRRLVYAPAAAVPLHWLSLLPLAVWRTVTHLAGKQPGRVWPEWAATLVTLVRGGAVVRSRRRLRASRRSGWARIAPLRVTREQLRVRLDGDGADPDAPIRSDLRFFTGGGAWTVLAALAVSVAAFPKLLAWSSLGGGGLLPLSSTLGELWAHAAYGQRAIGLDDVGAADPFAAVVAAIGSLSPVDPSRALVVLWLLALPLAVLGGWFAATRVTERSGLRIVAAVVWALAPTFLDALVSGRPAAVLAHLVLPWVLYAGATAHRSWAAAGTASLLLAVLLACAPSLAPAALVIWTFMILATALLRHGRDVPKTVWLVVPTLVLFAPLVWDRVRDGRLLSLVADPGLVQGGGVTADAAGRLMLAAGFPSPDLGGWASWPPGIPTWWVPLVAAPLAALALLSLLTPRWTAGVAALILALTGLATAFAAVSVAVSIRDLEAVPVWAGPALSLVWAAALAGAVTTLDAGIPERTRALRPALAAVLALPLAVAAVPALTAQARDVAAVTDGPTSTLPAYVAAEGRGDARLGTLVLTPQGDGVLARVVWGASETLDGQSTERATRTAPDAGDRDLAALTADLVATTDPDAVGELGRRGIAFILLAGSPDGDASAAAARGLGAAIALDQRSDLDPVGDTGRGTLWRVTADVQEREDAAPAVQRYAALIALVQLAVLGICLLLAVPTAASRRTARRLPRVVGLRRPRVVRRPQPVREEAS